MGRGNILSFSRMEYSTCPCVFRSGLSISGRRFLVSIRKSKSNALLINAFQLRANVEHRVVLSESEVMTLMAPPLNGRVSKHWYARLIKDTNVLKLVIAAFALRQQDSLSNMNSFGMVSDEECTKAAETIQRHYRGYQGRMD